MELRSFYAGTHVVVAWSEKGAPHFCKNKMENSPTSNGRERKNAGVFFLKNTFFCKKTFFIYQQSKEGKGNGKRGSLSCLPRDSRTLKGGDDGATKSAATEGPLISVRFFSVFKANTTKIKKIRVFFSEENRTLKKVNDH